MSEQWYESYDISEDQATTLSNYEDAGSYIRESLTREQGLIRPSDEAGEEDWNTFNSTLRQYNGVPESADAYDIKYTNGEEEHSLDMENGKELVERFHSLGLNNKQASGIMQTLMDDQRSLDKQYEENIAAYNSEQNEILRTEWGKDFDAKASAAKGVVAKYGGEEVAKMFEEHGAYENAGVMQFLEKLSGFGSEARGIQGDGASVSRSSSEIWQELQTAKQKRSGNVNELFKEWQQAKAYEDA